MQTLRAHSPASIFVLAAAGVALSGVAGLGFALWWRYGERIFVTLVENGLAWCY